MRELRFQVLTVEGFLSARGGQGGKKAPGVSATVYDSMCDRVIQTYRSEDAPRSHGVVRMRRRTLRRAHEHADRLNTWAEEVAA